MVISDIIVIIICSHIKLLEYFITEWIYYNRRIKDYIKDSKSSISLKKSYKLLNSNPPFLSLSQHVIRFHELPAAAMQLFLQ